MKNKKGFTLIELLAVIVILAIIALIATPIILNMINDARKNSAKSSALGYIDAIEYNNGFAQLGTTDINGTYEEIKSGDVTTANQKLGNHLKGKAPTSGTVTIDTKGKVTGADFCINGYNVTYDGTDAKVNGKCNGSNNNEPESTFGGVIDKTTQYSSTSVEQEGLIGVAYLNPTNLEAECTKETAVSTTGTKAGCMKFYIFAETSTTYKMILDHNTTAKVAWNSTNSNSETKEVKSALETDTAGWEGNPRLIEADEVAKITGADSEETLQWKQTKQNGTTVGTQVAWFFLDGGRNTNKTSYSESNGWQHQVAKSKGASVYAWLFDYTSDCESNGCNYSDSSTIGFWTANGVTGRSDRSWCVGRDGDLDFTSPNKTDHSGVRPVIEIEKSKLQ